MTKISKVQAQALAKKIVREIQEARKPFVDAQNSRIDAFIQSKISGELREMYELNEGKYKSTVTQFIYAKHASEYNAIPKLETFSSWSGEESIEQDIIVGSIDSEGLTELIASIKAKYIPNATT